MLQRKRLYTPYASVSVRTLYAPYYTSVFSRKHVRGEVREKHVSGKGGEFVNTIQGVRRRHATPARVHHRLHSNCCVDEICLDAPPPPLLLILGVLDFIWFARLALHLPPSQALAALRVRSLQPALRVRSCQRCKQDADPHGGVCSLYYAAQRTEK